MRSGHDFPRLFTEVWKQKGITPAEIVSLTPDQFMIVTGLSLVDRKGRPSDLELLAKANRTRAEKGQQPVVPFWLWPETSPRLKKKG